MALQTKTYTQSSNTFTLELTLVEQSTSTSGNSSSVSYTLKLKSTTKNFAQYGVGASVSLGGKTVAVRDRGSAPKITLGTHSEVTLLSGTVTIGHDNDGSKTISLAYDLDMASASYTPGPMSGSGSMTLTKIPRGATITNAPNFTDEDNPVVQVSNPAGVAVQLGIFKDSYTPLANYRTISGTSYTFRLTTQEREALRGADTAKNMTQVRFYIKSVVGGQTFTTYVSKTLTIKDPAPTLSPTVTDTNPDTVALTGDSGKMVRYHSNAAVTFRAQAVKKATLVGEKVTCGNKSITSDGTFTNVESGTFAFSVTDSRGNTTYEKVDKPLVKYIRPTCVIGRGTPDGTGTFDISVSGSAFIGTFGTVNNVLTVEYRFRQQGSDSWGEWIPMSVSTGGEAYSATSKVTGLDYKKAYEFQARVTDKLETIESSINVVKSVPVFDWSESDFNINGEFHIGGKSIFDLFYPVGSIYTSVNPTSPKEIFGGEWVQITGRFLYCSTTSKQTGGSNTINLAHTHTTGGHALTINEMPSHQHTTSGAWGVEVTSGYKYTGTFNVNDSAKGLLTVKQNMKVGGGASHSHGNTGSSLSNTANNNMPAYFTVYCWYRTA